MTRSDLRETVFRILFRYEFHSKEEFENQLELFFEQYPEEDDDPEEYTGEESQNGDDAVAQAVMNVPVEHWPKLTESDKKKIKDRVNMIIDKLPEVDEKLKAAMIGWKLERVGKTELSILRIAAFEICFDEDIEKPIAINEAVNLAKKYCDEGDEKAHAFVNGVLAKLA